jgi:hypothetical protein
VRRPLGQPLAQLQVPVAPVPADPADLAQVEQRRRLELAISPSSSTSPPTSRISRMALPKSFSSNRASSSGEGAPA